MACAAGIIFEPGKCRVKANLDPTHVLRKKRDQAHSPWGIFMAWGEGIKNGAKIDNVNIIDMAPTILYLMGKPVPADMDGRALKEILKPDFQKEILVGEERGSTLPPDCEKETEEIERRLKGLGYIS